MTRLHLVVDVYVYLAMCSKLDMSMISVFGVPRTCEKVVIWTKNCTCVYYIPATS